MKTTHVKNPLTIIAIFAGIAEVSGTIVAPFLGEEQQSVFVWFLMFFPVLLVVLFFWTLNKNSKVLYAPSDFADEDNYLKIHKYDPSTQETVVGETISTSSRSRIGKFKWKVTVTDFEDAADFVDKLISEGFYANVYDSDRDCSKKEDFSAIWIGRRVDPGVAVPVIKDAVSFYPHIKYLHVSGDNESEPPDFIHSQIHIGGSTKTAKNYGIEAFSSEELMKLPNDISKEKLHEFVRGNYKSRP